MRSEPLGANRKCLSAHRVAELGGDTVRQFLDRLELDRLDGLDRANTEHPGESLHRIFGGHGNRQTVSGESADLDFAVEGLSLIHI